MMVFPSYRALRVRQRAPPAGMVSTVVEYVGASTVPPATTGLAGECLLSWSLSVDNSVTANHQERMKYFPA